MANIKSAKKRCRVIKTKTEQNKTIKTGVKTAIKKVVVAAQSGNKEEAKVLRLEIPNNNFKAFNDIINLGLRKKVLTNYNSKNDIIYIITNIS